MVDGGASPKVERNVFTGNHGNFGGAMYAIRSSNPSVVGNLMLDNAAVSQGSAVECNGASPRFYNNTIADNTSLDGALYLTGGSHPMLVNNIIAFNASGLWSDSTSSVAMRDNEVTAGGLGINYRIYRVFGFLFSAALSGLAGAVYASFVGYLSPDSFGFSFTVFVLLMVVVGGS
jgi:hypothetical protein